MEIKDSAAKRHRQSEKRRLRNRMVKSRVRTELKKFQLAIKEQNAESAETQLKAVVKLLDTAARKGIYPKNTAARKKSRLSKAFLGVKA